MTNFGEPRSEPAQRRGLSPFPSGEPTLRKDESFLHLVEGPPISIGPFGIAKGRLIKPREGVGLDYSGLADDDADAFTIDLSGAITKGKAADFVTKGYWFVDLVIEPRETTVDELKQPYNVNFWLEGTKPLVTAGIESHPKFDLASASLLHKVNVGDETKTYEEHFMLPENPEILKALRFNIESGEFRKEGLDEDNNEPTS